MSLGNIKISKSRQAEPKLGTPKRLMITEEFRQNGRGAPGGKKGRLQIWLIPFMFFDDFDDNDGWHMMV